MQTTESVVVDAAPDVVYPFVADLAAYPAWMRLVHHAEPLTVGDGDPPAWSVEIRAQVGPFARSKRLRMERIDTVPSRIAVFERAEVDGRDHARWALRVELDAGDPGSDRPSTTVTMHLAYDGRLWTGGVLAKVLDDQIRRGRNGLIELVSDAPTR
jgi:hypothetical protein